MRSTTKHPMGPRRRQSSSGRAVAVKPPAPRRFTGPRRRLVEPVHRPRHRGQTPRRAASRPLAAAAAAAGEERMAEKAVGHGPRTRIRGGLAPSAPSAARRLSAVSYTAAPNLTKKVPDPKVVKPARRTTPVKKRPQVDQAQKQREELAALQEQLSGLQKKLLEKDEALRSAEHLISRISAANAAVDELRGQLSEKESQIESTGSELHGAKIQLAEKQAALEKLEWETKVSSTKVEELQVDVASMDVEISALMKLFRKITENDRTPYSRERTDDSSLECEPVQLDDMVGDIDMEKMEQEMSAYATALAAAKDNPTDEFLKAVTEARLRLQAFVL